jgi:hypothetical protein
MDHGWFLFMIDAARIAEERGGKIMRQRAWRYWSAAIDAGLVL